jgi:uncharacterized membrane protein
MAEPEQLPESQRESRPPRQQPEIILPALDGALRSAGVDPQNPEVTKALEVGFSLMVATGSLPVPPASILAEYNATIPGLGDKIIVWTEEQRKHRQGLEKQRTDGAERRMDRGQLITAVAAIWGLTMAAAVGIFGSPYVGITLAVVSIGGPTAAIWFAKGMNHKPSATPTPIKNTSA